MLKRKGSSIRNNAKSVNGQNRSVFYGEPACNLVGLAFHPRPFDRLIIVATPKRHFSAVDSDDNFALANIAVTSDPHFGNMLGDCENH
jgi:PIN domain nuclease of toxin-antitoxin system